MAFMPTGFAVKESKYLNSEVSLVGNAADVLVQVSVVRSASIGRTLGVDAQSQAASASLAAIPLARHITLSICESRRSTGEGIGAEALPSIFRASHAVSLGIAVRNALGICNFVVANVGEFYASHDSVAVGD